MWLNGWCKQEMSDHRARHATRAPERECGNNPDDNRQPPPGGKRVWPAFRWQTLITRGSKESGLCSGHRPSPIISQASGRRRFRSMLRKRLRDQSPASASLTNPLSQEPAHSSRHSVPAFAIFITCKQRPVVPPKIVSHPQPRHHLHLSTTLFHCHSTNIFHHFAALNPQLLLDTLVLHIRSRRLA